MSDDLTVLGPDGIWRSYDEHYDTKMDVEQDPTGAHQAIQRQHARIEKLEAVIGRQHKQAETLAEGWRISDDARIELEAKLAKAVEEAEKYQHAFAAQSRKLQAVLHIDGVRTTIAELTGGKDE